MSKLRLETELRFFDEHREELLQQHAGKYALIKGETLHGAFDTQENAYEHGVDLFGPDEFLIKQVLPEDPVEDLTSHILGLTHALL